MRKLPLLALLASFSALTPPVWASTVIYRTDAQLVALSERVVHGRVIGQRTARGGPAGRTIYTVTTLQVIEDLTGVDAATVDVWELGGRIGDEELYVGGAVRFSLGQEVLVCLERGPQGLRTVAMGFSTFDVLAEVNSERRLRRNLRETLVVGGAVAREPFLSEMRTLATRTTGRPARPGRQPIAGGELQSVSQPFTLLGSPPFRWVQADSGTPVTWYINTSAASPLTSGNITTEMQTALSAWTSPASASIVLQYGGTTFQSDADGPFSGLASAAGVVTFEDPNNQINGSVLAVGGGWAGGNGGTVNGTSFAAFTRGYVIFQNAANLSPSFRQPPNFTRVLIHEIGHAIGLGHTQTDGSVPSATSNIMYPSCCSGNTPLPPAIGPDDLGGLNFVYPLGAPSCTYSITPTSASAAAVAGSGSVSVTTQTGCSWTAVSNSGFLGISSGSSGSGSGSVGYTVAANAMQSPRSGTLTIAGQTFAVNQAAAPCTFTLTPSTASAPAAGGTGSLTVSAAAGCTWSATSNAPFVSITSGAGGSGSGSVGYSVTANGTNFRSGSLTVAGQTFTVYQFGSGPMVSIDRPSLRYGATNSAGLVTAQTSAQVLRLTQAAGPAVSWTATSNRPWLAVSPTSGSGARDLTVTVTPGSLTTPGTAAGAITLSLTGAGNIVAPVTVTLVTMTTGTSVNPVGVIDTPLQNATGVVGAIPVTGWALDDVEVANVFVCRNPVAGESPGVDGRCGGTARIYIGDAVFIDDARPDVSAGYPTLPRNYRGGWGFMLLTNMLPNQGNGAYTLAIYAMDREGHVVSIGSRALTCDNANATRPFGAIDTPGQGGTASGASFVNFGWALTPLPKYIPNDGSTITVFVDGVALGNPTYNNFRSDIASLFPNLNNTNGAIGYRVIDTTSLSNGMHTIAWTVTDNLGSTEGIGSRYFRVSNGTSPLTSALADGVLTAGSQALTATAVSRPMLGRLGWNPDVPWQTFAVNASGRAIVRSEEIGRIELHLGDGLSGRVEGYLRVGDALAALPVGSTLDPGTGVFTWQPGVGYVGNYDLLFVRRDGDRILDRQDVRVVLHAKGSGFVGPQVVIDVPTSQADVAQPFVLAGWAADLGAADGTGIATLHTWAYPLAGGAPVFVGAAAYGGARPDVAAVHGEQFRNAGYGLVVQGLAHGNYDLAVFAWSTEAGDFVPARTVRVTVR
jgi:Viral BACON domain